MKTAPPIDSSRRWRLAVIDMIGTTFRDDGAVLEAMRSAIAAVAPERAVRDEDVYRLRGAAKKDLFRALVPQRADAALEAFRSSLGQRIAEGRVVPIAGAETALRRLRDAGVPVVLTTGLDRGVADLILEEAGWSDVATAVLTTDDVARGRPAPDLVLAAAERCGVGEMDRVVVCGDTSNDLSAGANAGAGLLVGVLTGAHDEARLGRAPHHHIVESIARLPDLLGAVD